MTHILIQEAMNLLDELIEGELHPDWKNNPDNKLGLAMAYLLVAIAEAQSPLAYYVPKQFGSVSDGD